MQASREGLTEVVQHHLNTSPEQVNEQDNDFYAPLHHAARYNRIAVMELLLNAGAGESGNQYSRGQGSHHLAPYMLNLFCPNKSRLELFEKDFRISHEFKKYLKESCGLDFDQYFCFKYFLKFPFVRELLLSCMNG